MADRFGMAAMVTNQPFIARVEPKVRPASLTGKAMFVVSHLQVLVQRFRSHDAQRIVFQAIVPPDVEYRVCNDCVDT